MAQTKTIQLLRSTAAYADIATAKSTLKAMSGRKDGELVLARYWQDNEIKSLLGIYHAAPDLSGTNITENEAKGWTFIQDQSTVDAILDNLDFNTGNMSVGGSTATDDSVIVVGVAQNNGQLQAVTAELGSVKVNSVTATSATSKIAADQTLTENLGRLQGQIDDMDLTQVGGTSGDVVTAVSQADGKVSASKSSLTNVVMTGYAADSTKTGTIAATDTLEQAFNKVENAISSTTVKSTDKTVSITDNGGKDLAVNIDGTTIVKDESTGVLSADLTLVALNSTEIAALSDSNVKEAYKMIYSTDDDRTAIGSVVKIYKDSSLLSVALLHADLTANPQLKPTYSNNTWTDIASASQTEANLALCFAYQLADGTTSVEAVPVGNFLRESEFSDGLQVTNGVVTVKVGDGLEFGSEATGNKSVKVKIDTNSTDAENFLSVSSDGVKISGVGTAISNAINALDVTTDTAVAGQYVAAIEETDGVVAVKTRANVSDAVLTGYSKGSAPASGSEAVAATDDVKGAIAKLEHQVDAAKTAASTAVAGLDGTADATSVTSGNVPTADFQVLTKVVETDGVVLAVGATNGSTSATLKKLAATGAAEDVSVATDATSGLAAGNVQDTLEALTAATNNGLDSISSGNAAIAVGTKTNKRQTVSLVLDTTTTTGNITSDMLEINSNGLMMKDTWDCGVF